MRVCVEVIPDNLSQAMYRVTRALRESAPVGVKLVMDPRDADLQVVHVIGPNAIAHIEAPDYALIQYCLYTATADPLAWAPLWKDARVVWSYYDLQLPKDVRFYYAPLGVDGRVFRGNGAVPRYVGVITSGYVAGPGAEAIEEMAEAALRCGLSVFHLGPRCVDRMKPRVEKSWAARLGLSDEELAGIYQRSRWVSGLRHVEGFELPVLEGLACGARPIVFDRPDMRQWYDGHATFVPECDGEALVKELVDVMTSPPCVVNPEERREVLTRFDWKTITEGFWKEVLR